VTTRALVVDDERLARVVLRKLLEAWRDVQIVGEANSLSNAAEAVRTLDPDVVFLDIQMPDGTGFDLFERATIRGRVIFVTAYEQHALRAFEVNALDYLLKPVTPDGLARALERLDANRGTPAESAAGLMLDDVVSLPSARGLQFTAVRDVIFIQRADDYTEVFLASGRSVLTSTSLETWAERLPGESFVRIHRSTIANLVHVVELKLEQGPALVLQNGQTLRLSRRCLRALRQRLLR